MQFNLLKFLPIYIMQFNFLKFLTVIILIYLVWNLEVGNNVLLLDSTDLNSADLNFLNKENLDSQEIKDKNGTFKEIKQWFCWRIFKRNTISFNDFKLNNNNFSFKSTFKSEFKNFKNNPFEYVNNRIENKNLREKVEISKFYENTYGLKGVDKRLSTAELQYLLSKANNKK